MGNLRFVLGKANWLCLAVGLVIASVMGCKGAPRVRWSSVTPQQRLGFGVNKRYGNVTSFDVRQLRAGWYSDWDISADPPRPAGLEYAQLVSVGHSGSVTDRQALIQVVKAQRGALWIIGNEPERRALAGAPEEYNYADLTPREYAALYQEYYQLIKQNDRTALVAIGGVVQPSPLRLRWLSMVLEEYKTLTGKKMPVDIWNIHVQILREKRAFPDCPDCWGADIPKGIEDVKEGLLLEIKDNANFKMLQDMVWAFRRWMKEQGEQDKPLIISEYGVLMPSEYLGETAEEGDKVVHKFMTDSFDFFLNTRDKEVGFPQDDYRLVQKWLWYSLNEPPFHFDEERKVWVGFNGGLFDWKNPDWPGTLTPLGRAFAEYAASK